MPENHDFYFCQFHPPLTHGCRLKMSFRIVISLFSFCYLFIFNPYSTSILVFFSSVYGGVENVVVCGLQKVALCSMEFFQGFWSHGLIIYQECRNIKSLCWLDHFVSLSSPPPQSNTHLLESAARHRISLETLKMGLSIHNQSSLIT